MRNIVLTAMTEQHIAVSELAAIVGMRKGALAARIHGTRRWTAGGLLTVADALGLDAVRIFRIASDPRLTYPCVDRDVERVG